MPKTAMIRKMDLPERLAAQRVEDAVSALEALSRERVLRWAYTHHVPPWVSRLQLPGEMDDTEIRAYEMYRADDIAGEADTAEGFRDRYIARASVR